MKIVVTGFWGRYGFSGRLAKRLKTGRFVDLNYWPPMNGDECGWVVLTSLRIFGAPMHLVFESYERDCRV